MNLVCYGMGGGDSDVASYPVDVDSILGVEVVTDQAKVIETEVYANTVEVEIQANNVEVDVEILEKEVSYGC
jgi:regulatory protein YycI of two-component signal transduction system YycFG